jgi:nucleotide-binding universal stress UspA family protein
MNGKMKILIAYDGSACADAALDDLQRAGLPAEAQACVLTVAEVWLPPPPPSVHEIAEASEEMQTPADLQRWYAKGSRAVEEAGEMAVRATERLRKNFHGWEVTPEATYGSPAWEIIMKADGWNPDLVVVGSQGRTALGRFLMGSVSQKVLTEARTSVRVARGRVEVDATPARIVVGVDGSPYSLAAARSVASRVWPLGSEVKLIVVADPLVPSPVGRLIPPLTRWVEEGNQSEREWAMKMAQSMAHELRAAELRAEPVVLEGDPKRVLVEEAERWGADCVFVGSMGFSNRFERFLLGSVSAAVAARAHCSVEVVRTPKRPDAAREENEVKRTA